MAGDLLWHGESSSFGLRVVVVLGKPAAAAHGLHTGQERLSGALAVAVAAAGWGENLVFVSWKGMKKQVARPPCSSPYLGSRGLCPRRS